MNLFDVSGKVTLITGSSAGLGLALAEGFARAGAEVVLNGRTEETLRIAAERLAQMGRVHPCLFDVTDTPAMTRRVAEIEKQVGPVEILVNNAGMTRRAPLEQLAAADWDAVIELNLSAVFRVTKAVATGMIARKRGKIINIASLMSRRARPTTAAYCAAKGGLAMLTKAMAVEWGKYNIQANAIGPGYFLTELTRPLSEDPEFDGWVKSRTPAGRWGEPRDLTGTALFLASAASDFINGQIIYVDGGWLAGV